jgi:mannose-1-phosphate guanylyltransferase
MTLFLAVCVFSGLTLYLASKREHKPEVLATGPSIVGNVIIDESVKLGEGCKIGPNVSIGAGCEIGAGVRLSNSVLLHRVKVKDYARVADSIVGWASTLGSWSRLENKCVIGEDVHVRVSGARLCLSIRTCGTEFLEPLECACIPTGG